MQTPCIADDLKSEEISCGSTQCCSDESSEQEEKGPKEVKTGSHCCVYNVLSVEAVPQFSYRQVHALRLKTGFLEKFYLDTYASDFWQPPRA